MCACPAAVFSEFLITVAVYIAARSGLFLQIWTHVENPPAVREQSQCTLHPQGPSQKKYNKAPTMSSNTRHSRET